MDYINNIDETGTPMDEPFFDDPDNNVEAFDEKCVKNEYGDETCTFKRTGRFKLFGKCNADETKIGMYCYPNPPYGYICRSKDCTKITLSPRAPICTKSSEGDEMCKYVREKKPTYLGTPNGCALNDEEKINGMCYTKPLPGYSCVDVNCYKFTPTPPKVTCVKSATGETCSYVRKGVQKIDSTGKYIPCGTNEDLVGALCYPKPITGYTCKNDFCTKFTGIPVATNTGQTCSYAGDTTTCTYKRTGYPSSTCKTGEELISGLCYIKPLTGFTCAGDTCKKKTKSTAPSNMAIACTKATNGKTCKYTRIGFTAPTCNTTTQVREGTLCYLKPVTGYTCSGNTCSKFTSAAKNTSPICTTTTDGKTCTYTRTGYPIGTGVCPVATQVKEGTNCYLKTLPGYSCTGATCKQFTSAAVNKPIACSTDSNGITICRYTRAGYPIASTSSCKTGEIKDGTTCYLVPVTGYVCTGINCSCTGSTCKR